jgi:hypothetical protein
MEGEAFNARTHHRRGLLSANSGRSVSLSRFPGSGRSTSIAGSGQAHSRCARAPNKCWQQPVMHTALEPAVSADAESMTYCGARSLAHLMRQCRWLIK